MKYHIIPVTDFNQNCSVIWCEKSNDAMVVDPGGETEKLCNQINMLPVIISKIVLTHGHIDHVGSAMELKKYYRVPILGPDIRDRYLLNNLELQCKILGIDYNMNTEIVCPDFWLKEGDQIKIGFENFKILHCPGHSPGHIVFWNELCKFVVMGDVLFKKNIGRSDLPGGNSDILINSIFNKLLTLEDDTVFLPGHGPMSTIGYERENNFHLK